MKRKRKPHFPNLMSVEVMSEHTLRDENALPDFNNTIYRSTLCQQNSKQVQKNISEEFQQVNFRWNTFTFTQ